MATNDWTKVLIPVLRNHLPKILAEEIVGVQPMMQKRLTYEVMENVAVNPPGYHAIYANIEIGHWIEQQPVHMWKFYDLDHCDEKWRMKTQYIVSDQLLTWLKMRWQ